MSVSRLRLSLLHRAGARAGRRGAGILRAAPSATPAAPPAAASAASPAASTVPAPSTAPVAPVGPHAGPYSFADLAAKLLPAVVNVSSSSHVEARANSGPGGGPEVPLFPPGSPFEQFFKDFMDRNRPGGQGGQGVRARDRVRHPRRPPSGRCKASGRASSSIRPASW